VLSRLLSIVGNVLGVALVALLFPLAILIVGTPVVLVVRALVALIE
jgi:hypothetical protein